MENEVLNKTIENLVDKFSLRKASKVEEEEKEVKKAEAFEGKETKEEEKKEEEEKKKKVKKAEGEEEDAEEEKKGFDEAGDVDEDKKKKESPTSADASSGAAKAFSEGGEANADKYNKQAPVEDPKGSGAAAIDTSRANGGKDRIGKSLNFNDMNSVITVLKALHEENKDLRKSLDGMEEKFEKIASQPASVRKSMSGLTPVLRGGENVDGVTSNSRDLNKSKVISALDDLQKSATDNTVFWSDYVTQTEIHKGPITAETPPFANKEIWGKVLEKINS